LCALCGDDILEFALSEFDLCFVRTQQQTQPKNKMSAQNDQRKERIRQQVQETAIQELAEVTTLDSDVVNHFFFSRPHNSGILKLIPMNAFFSSSFFFFAEYD
jgi:hypothetical protein